MTECSRVRKYCYAIPFSHLDTQDVNALKSSFKFSGDPLSVLLCSHTLRTSMFQMRLKLLLIIHDLSS